MKSLILTLATIAWGSALLPPPTGASESPSLTGIIKWGNNDALPGDLLDSTDTAIQWRSAIFPTPLTLDSGVVQRIELSPDPSSSKTKEPLSIVTRSREVLYGTLTGLVDGHLELSSQRHGAIRVPLDAVRRVRRLNNPSVQFDGPLQLSGWRTISRARRTEEWSETAEGQLTTAAMGAELFRDLELPPVSEIQLSLAWTRKPGFLITFATPNALRLSKEAVRLETWDDELVLQTLASNGDFAQIKTLSDDVKKIDLRLLWNQEIGELSVYSEYGERLGSMATGKGTTQGHGGFYIRNKGSDLSLVAVRVGSWGGTLPGQERAGQLAFYLTEGEPVFGSLDSYEAASDTFRVREADGSERKITLEQIGSIDFGRREDWPETPSNVQLSYSDGALLRGSLQSIEGPVATMIANFSSQPIRCNLEGAREIRFFSADKAEQDLDQDLLEYRDVQMHGRLAPAGADGEQLGWLAVGSRAAVPLAPDEYIRVVRPLKKDPERKQAASDSDMVHLINGDVFPCRIIAIEEDSLELEVGLGDVSSISTKHVKAIELNTSTHDSLTGFREENWVVKPGNKDGIVLTEKEITFRGTGTVGHANLMWANQIEFDVKWNNAQPSGLSVNLFASEPDSSSLTSILLYFAGDQIYVRGFQPGPNHFQQVANAPQFNTQQARIRLVWTAKSVQMLFNDQEVWQQEMPRKNRQGRALVFSAQHFGVAAMGGGDVEAVPADTRLLTLSNLAVHQTSGASITSALHEENRDYVLTVPRNRKQNPPRHLLVAQNGDVLRGRLLALTDKHAQFISRMDEMRLPRQRLAGLIWLHDEAHNAETLELDQRLARATFVNDQRFTFIPEKMIEGSILGRHPVLGKCRLPVASVRSLEVGHLNAKPQYSVFQSWKPLPAAEPKFADAAAAGGGNQGSGPGIGSPLIGAEAPAFTAATLGADKFRLRDHAGKIVVLDFWATWCPPCVKGLPELADSLAAYPPERLLLVTVNMQEPENTIREFLKARNLEVNVVLDANGEISRDFQVEAIPQTVVIGPNGKIERLYVGQTASMKEDLKQVIEQLLVE